MTTATQYKIREDIKPTTLSSVHVEAPFDEAKAALEEAIKQATPTWYSKIMNIFINLFQNRKS